MVTPSAVKAFDNMVVDVTRRMAVTGCRSEVFIGYPCDVVESEVTRGLAGPGASSC
jgi:hypothetical protein